MTVLTANPSRIQLWAEFAALFIGVPLLMVAFFGQYSLFSIVWVLAGVALILLILTSGWSWSSLLKGPVLGEWKLILIFALGTAAVCTAFVFTLVPDRFLDMPQNRTALWIIIMTAYPLLSALPQELIYRSLFFERYGDLFPNAQMAIIANGLAFGIGHLFYMNTVTIAMTAIGGAVMGWAYMRGRSMLLAWVLHAIAGNLIFTLGLGLFFYHGAVG
ncbi:MAG: CPBP family intramembrane glutamic endopeptidase [Pseudomonadota bacterium]